MQLGLRSACHVGFFTSSGDEEKVLLGSEKGEVMLVHNGDLRGNIAIDAEAAINAIVPTSKVCSSC